MTPTPAALTLTLRTADGRARLSLLDRDREIPVLSTPRLEAWTTAVQQMIAPGARRDAEAGRE